MSTILDALRRLEEERREQRTRTGLDERVAAAPTARRDPLRLLVWLATAAAAASVGAAVAGLVLWLRSPGESPLPPSSAGASLEAPRARAQRDPLPERAHEPGRGRTPLEARGSAPMPVQPPTSSALAAGAPRPLERDTVPEELASDPQLERENPLSGAPERESEPRIEIVPAPATGPAQVRDVHRAMPALRVERTVWHPRAERRSAVVVVGEDGEPREVREGDELVAGWIVQKIDPAAVEVSDPLGGPVLRRRVGD